MSVWCFILAGMLNRYCLRQKVHIATRYLIISPWSPTLCKMRWGRSWGRTGWSGWYRWHCHWSEIVKFIIVAVRDEMLVGMYIASTSDRYLLTNSQFH